MSAAAQEMGTSWSARRRRRRLAASLLALGLAVAGALGSATVAALLSAPPASASVSTGWTASRAPLPSVDAAGDPPGTNPDVQSLAPSCASVDFCVAAGTYVDSGGNLAGFIDTLSNGSWTSIAAPLPATDPDGQAAGSTFTQLQAVSCASASSCVVVGNYDDASRSSWGLIDTFSGSTWSASAAPEPASNAAGQAPGSDTAKDEYAGLDAVSCASASSCVAVGQYEDAAGYRWGLADVLSGTSWSATAAPEPATNADGQGPGDETNNLHESAFLEAASCASASSCVVVGYYADATNHNWGLLDTLSTGSWSATAAPEPATNAAGQAPGNDTTNGDEMAFDTAVSCVAATSCVAVGRYRDAAGYTWGLLDTLSTGSWSATAAPEPATNAAGQPPGDETTNGHQWANLAAVSCTSASSCVAVGNYEDAGNYDWGLLDTLSSGSWSAAAAPEPATNPAGRGPGDETTNDHQYAQLVGISCVAATGCIAAGYYSDASGLSWGLLETPAGTSWSAQAAPLPSDSSEPSGASASSWFEDPACAVDGSCVVAGWYQDSSRHMQGGLDTFVPAPPVVGELSASSGAPGSTLVVTGSGFTPASTASFGSVPAATSYLSPSELEVVVPAGSGTVDVVVTNAGESSATGGAASFSYPVTSASVPPAPAGPTPPPAASPPTSAATGAGPGSSPSPVRPALRLADRLLQVRRDEVMLRVYCARPRCRGTLELAARVAAAVSPRSSGRRSGAAGRRATTHRRDPSRSAGLRALRRTVVLCQGRYDLRRSGWRWLTVHLDRRAVALLRRARSHEIVGRAFVVSASSRTALGTVRILAHHLSPQPVRAAPRHRHREAAQPSSARRLST